MEMFLGQTVADNGEKIAQLFADYYSSVYRPSSNSNSHSSLQSMDNRPFLPGIINTIDIKVVPASSLLKN